MKKIVRVTTEIENGKEVISVVTTTKGSWTASRLSAKMTAKVNDFIRNAKYRKEWRADSVFEIMNNTHYDYSNAAI